MGLAGVARAGTGMAEDPDLGGRWIVISQTESRPGPGLQDTSPYSGLRPGYFVKVEDAFADKQAALARLKALHATRCGQDRCYVRHTGERLETVALEQARTLAARTSGGQVTHAQLLSLRGYQIPLVVVRTGTSDEADEDCLEAGEVLGAGTQVWLFWSAAGRRLAEFQGASGLLCCRPWETRPAPARLRVLAATCQAASCGGACVRTTRVIAVPEDMPHEAVALDLRCDQVVSALPAMAAQTACDRLETSDRSFRLSQTETRVTPCPKDDGLVERAEERVRTLEYRDGLLKRSTGAWKPRLPDLWGCD
jgi:hypothetical protein